MQHSDTLTKLAAALVAAQAEISHAKKDATNPHYRSDYATLASVLDATKPALTKHGLSVVQMPGWSIDGGGHVTLETILIHSSGEWISGLAASPIAKSDPQGVGSALTYLRRYALAALAGIAQVDDDGESAVPREDTPAPKPRTKPTPPAPTKLVEQPEADESETLVTEVRAMLRHGVPDAGRKAALQAIETKDVARLRAAAAWLRDQVTKGEHV